MKKKFLACVILLVAIFSYKGVNAKLSDVAIQAIEIEELNGNVEILGEPKHDNLTIKYDLVFKTINDSVKYKVRIKNSGNEDVYINNKGNFGGSEYVTYNYIWDDNQNVIKGNSTKTFDVVVTYKKAVPDSLLSSGKYYENKNLVIKVSDENGNKLPAKNPSTDSNLSIYFILFSFETLMVLAVVAYLIKTKKLNKNNIKQMKKVNTIVAIIFASLVLKTIITYSYALETMEMKVESNIKIIKARLAMNCSAYAGENENCIDWDELVPYSELESIYAGVGAPADPAVIREKVKLITIKTKDMPNTYNYNGETYTIMHKNDISDVRNGEVMLGVYKGTSSMLLVIGQDGGVIAPVYAKALFKHNDGNNMQQVLNFVTEIDLNNIDFSDTTTMEYMLYHNGMLSNSWKLTGTEGWNISNVHFMSHMFEGVALNADEISISNIDHFDTSNVIDMSSMFKRSMRRLGVINISDWNVSNVENMSEMFKDGLISVNSLDISNWDVSKVKDMSGMFYDTLHSLETFDISRWNVSNVENMSEMFSSSLDKVNSLDLSNWDVSKVKDMTRTFSNALSGGKTLNLSNWNPVSAPVISSMFEGTFFGNSEDTDVYAEIYLNSFELKNNLRENVFKNIFPKTILHVKNEAQKNWILQLGTDARPASWTDNNFVIVEE